MELNEKSDASGAASEIMTVQSLMDGEDGKQVGEAPQPPKLRVGPKRAQAPSGYRGPRQAKKKKERGPSSSEGKPTKREAGSNAAREAQPTNEKPNAGNADSGNDADVESSGSERRGRKRLAPPHKSLRIRAINHGDFF